MKILKCKKCGNIVDVIDEKTNSIMCCGQLMNEMSANSNDGAVEKHVPYTEIRDDMLYVKIGEVSHPMEEKHYIMWIAADYGDSIIRFYLNPGDEPEACFDYIEGMTIYSYCNLHGLWKTEL